MRVFLCASGAARLAHELTVTHTHSVKTDG